MAILSSPSESAPPSDPSLLLAGELIAAKLNRAQGSDRTISRAIADADRALREFQGKLPYHVSSSSSTGEKMLDEAKTLNSYNSGSSSACVTGNEQTKSNRQKVTTTQVQRPTRPASETRGSNAVALSGPRQTPSAGSSTPLLPFIRKGVTALAVKGDGSVIAGAGTDNRIRVWNVATGLQTLVLPPSLGLPTGLVFNPDNRTLSSVGRDSIVRLWDVVSGTEIADLAGHEQAIRAIAVSPDGRFLATAGEDTRIMLWDLASRKLNKILVGAQELYKCTRVQSRQQAPRQRRRGRTWPDLRCRVREISLRCWDIPELSKLWRLVRMEQYWPVEARIPLFTCGIPPMDNSARFSGDMRRR